MSLIGGGESLQYSLNRIAGLDGSYSGTYAANVLAGTTGRSMVAALNLYAGTNEYSLPAVLNFLAGTEGLSSPEAARQIETPII
jgi:hypothetical protein